MPRVYTVKSARPSKFTRRCVTCGEEVQRFETYRYAEPRTGPKQIWCYRHFPKRSQLSTSKLGPLWDAIDEYDSTKFENVDDLKTSVEEISSLATSIQEEYEDSLSNMPTSEGPIGEQMQENIDFLESYVSDLDSIDFSDGKTDDEVRPEIEIMVTREILDEMGVDYEDDQLSDVIERGKLREEHIAMDVFQTQVDERCDEALNGSLEEIKERVQEVVNSFEG